MPETPTLFSIFAEVCARTPEQIAIEDASGAVSYDALAQMVATMGAALHEAGVVKGQCVGLSLPRDRFLPAAILAVLRLGCTYVPLDPAAPVQRRNGIIGQASVGHVICASAEEGIAAQQLTISALLMVASENCPASTRPELATIIFTSGSTGAPKGVEITEAGILRLAHAPGYVPLKKGVRISCLANPAFDALTFEVFGALLNGGTLCMIAQGELHDIAALSDRFRQDRPDALFLTASLFNLLVETDPGCLADAGHVLVGGEPLRPASVARFYAANTGCRARIVNGYGPTECTTFALTYLVEPKRADVYVERGRVPIGRPVDQTSAYILRADGRLADTGEVGRLFLGGLGVARGYVCAPDLTAEKFVVLPEISTSRLYDTGDMVRADALGVIEYVGRADGQVKIRGHRVELAEVESQLALHPQVVDAAVAAVETTDSNQLQAVLVCSDRDVPSVAELRAFLGRALPPYMIPQKFLSAASLPRTANGKIDRAALVTSATGELPAGAQEMVTDAPGLGAVQRVIYETLGITTAPDATFQELGGESLDAMRVVGRLAADHGLRGTVGDLLNAPSLAVFAAGLVPMETQQSADIDPELPYPAAKEQARLVFLHRLDPDCVAYNETFCFDIAGALDATLLRSALENLLERHVSLRTGYGLEDGQVIATPVCAWDIDLSPCSEDAARALCEAPYDLSQGRMMRAALVHLNKDQHLLYLGFHHVAIDGHSITRLMEELSELMAGGALASTVASYPAFAAAREGFAASQSYRNQIAAWREELTQHRGDRFSPLFTQAEIGRRAASYENCFVNAKEWDRLKTWAAANGVTLFSALVTVFAKSLAHRTGRTDIAIGTPVANRGLGAFEDLVGMCVNTLPIFVDLEPEQAVRSSVMGIDRQIKHSFARQDVDFDEIAALASEIGHGSPLFDAMLVLENTHAERLIVPGLDIVRRHHSGREAKFPLTLFVTETSAGAELLLEFCEEEVPSQDASFLIAAFAQGVARVPNHAADTLQALPAMSAVDRENVATWAVGGEIDVAPVDPLRVLADHASMMPDTTAVFDEKQSLSYAELEQRAACIAMGLKRQGVGHGTLVGICLTRCVDLLSTVLAVWKAGAAYVPLDPSHPDERLAYLLEDSGAGVVITEVPLSANVLPVNCVEIAIDRLIASDGVGVEFACPAPEDRAYVMYTSGSTGQPKGVAISHRALASYLSHAVETYFPDVDSALVSSAFTFDATLTTLLAPLVAGKSIRFLAQDGAEVPTLAKLLQEATAPLLLKVTPTHMWALLNYLSDSVSPLPHCFVIGGEALDQTVAERFQTLFAQARLINEYGPTETVVGCTTHQYSSGQVKGDVPIGRPIAGARIRLLDQLGADCPPGVSGEIMIGGAGLGIGYHNRPSLTEERFVTLADGQRYYSSGDLAYWSRDGLLHYLGRKDEQIKVRGYRIEPAEVETALRQLTGVVQAVINVRAAPDGSAVFAGYLVCPDNAFDPTAMTGELARRLPAHLVPDVLVRIDSLPITANGKLDRAALPDPSYGSTSPDEHIAANQDLITSLTEQISELVGYPVDADTNFFEAGLNSLLLMKLHSALVKRQGLSLELVDFFTYTTARALAEYLSGQMPDEGDDDTPQGGVGHDQIAIIGMAVNLPNAPDLDAFRDSIMQGLDNFSTIGATTAADGTAGQVGVSATMDGLFDFDPEYFGLSAADAELMDPQQRLILMGAVHALENAGLAPGHHAGLPVGVYVSSSENQYQQTLLRAGAGEADQFQMSLLNEKDFVSTRIAYHLNLTGPAMTVQSACSSSLAALHVACQQLRAGECQVALAGGVSADPRLLDGYTYRPGRIYAHDGHCRAFGADANGTVPANGMGLVVLKPLAAAQADGDRIYATIRASALSNDGYSKVSFTAPSVSGQSRAISHAMSAAGVRPDQIGYIEAHGTGTPLGDPIEFEALGRVFGDASATSPHCALGSVKSQLGHTASAAGIVGLIRATLGIHGRIIPATFGAETPNPNLPIAGSPFYLNSHPKVWASDSRMAGVSSFGMGGTNAHVVISNAPEVLIEGGEVPEFLAFSAHCTVSLRRSVKAALDGLADGTLRLSALAKVQAATRSHYNQRAGFYCRNSAEALDKLSAFLETGQASEDIPEAGQRWMLRLADAPLPAKAVLPLDTKPYPFDKRVFRKAVEPLPSVGVARAPIDAWIYQHEWRRRQRVMAGSSSERDRIFVGVRGPIGSLETPASLTKRLRADKSDHMPEVVILQDTAEVGCFSEAVAWMQSAIQGAGTAAITLTLVARGDDASASSALLRGLMLAVPVEHPNMRVRVLHANVDASAEQISSALDALEDTTGEFALRGHWLCARDLASTAVPKYAAVHHGGVHLVIGATGGIGGHVAQAIVAQGGTVIALSRKVGVKRLRECPALNGNAQGALLKVRGDITDATSMELLARDILDRFGGLQSVYHCAGDVGSGPLAQLDPAQVTTTIACRAAGLEVVEDVFLALKPARIVLCASMSSQFGVAGQADYAAISSYTCAWAEQMSDKYPNVVTTAIAWPTWRGTGMAANATLTPELVDYAITPQEGIAILDQAINLGVPALFVCPLPPDHMKTVFHASARSIPTAGASGLSVEDLFRQVLGVEAVGPDDDFFDLGGDSLSALDLLDLLEAKAPGQISMADLHSDATVAGIRVRIGQTSVEQSTVVQLRDGDGGPVVCVAPIGGDPSGYAEMAQRLTAQMPVKGMRDPVYFETAPQDRSVAQLAQRYLSDLQGEMPSVLVGWSFGAMVAWQMAQDLQAGGAIAPPLVLIDPPAIGHHAAVGLGPAAILMRELSALANGGGQDQAFTNAMRTACTLNADAMQNFGLSSPPVCSPVILLVANEGEAPPAGFADRTTWLSQTWQPLTQRDFSVRTLPTDHYGIMTGDDAAQIAWAVQDALRATQLEDALI